MVDYNIDEMIVALRDKDPGVQKIALGLLHEQVKSNQGKIAAQAQDLMDTRLEIAKCLSNMEDENRRYLNDLLSVMSTLENDASCLRYRIAGNVIPLSEWTHQYVTKLIKNILDVEFGEVEAERYEPLVPSIIEYLLNRNSEVEAIDFIVEVSRVPKLGREEVSLFSDMIKNITSVNEKSDKTVNNKAVKEPRMEYFDLLVSAIDSDNRMRVVLYLEQIAKFYDLEDVILRVNAYSPSRCLVSMIKYGRIEEAIAYTRGMTDEKMKKQLLYILAKNSIYYPGDENEEAILSNSHVKTFLSNIIEMLEIAPPKKLDYMFKGLNRDKIDMSVIANSLVHFGFCRDPVLFPQPGDFKIKEEYTEQLKAYKSTSTLASIGLIGAFNPEFVTEKCAQEIFAEPEIGGVLALALASSKLKDTDSSILNLLSMFLSATDSKDVIAALVGISLIYTGKADTEVYNLIFPLLSSSDNNIALFAIYVLGCVFPGDMQVLSSCIDVYEQLKKDTIFSNFAILGMGLFFYKIRIAVSLNESGANSHISDKNALYLEQFNRLDNHSKVLALGLMNVGTGNPSIVDQIFSGSFVGEIDALLESIGLLSCCLVGLGDSMSSSLLTRISTSSLLLDSPHLRNIVPLCMGILNASNPTTEIVDILEKSVNSGEANINSLIGLGIAGAGSCSSRILRIFESNFCNVYKDTRASSALIVGQGLVNLGKGLFTLSPMCYDNQIMLHRSVVGLVSTFFIFLESGMFKDYPFLLYLLSGAVTPKYVAGAEGIVRVGKPVETVGLVGRPNRISAAVIHSLPVIINCNERAEAEDLLCTDYVEDILVKRE